MPRRASLKGKGADIFYPNGEGEEAEADSVSPATAAPEEETAAPPPKKRTPRKSRAGKPQEQPAPTAATEADAAVAAAAPPVKTPATVTIASPPPATPVSKVPPPVQPTSPALPSTRDDRRTPPLATRSTPPPSRSQPMPLAPPLAVAKEVTTSDRYERLANEIDGLYEIATRKIAAGQGVGQAMQWLRDARRQVLGGKTADFAEAELLVMHVRGLLKHGDEIDQLYTDVEQELSDNPDMIQECMDWLHQARQRIMTGNLDDLIEAEYRMEKVKGVLARVKKSRAAASSWRTRILWLWLISWLVAFLTVFILDKPIAETLHNFGLRSASGQVPVSVTEIMLPWLCLVWGGVGSVFDTLIAINEHMAKRTYDGHYTAQGFASPMYGAILGTLIYFLFAGGLIAIGTGVAFSSAIGPPSGAERLASAIAAARSLALWAISFLAGFFHIRTLELLGRIFNQILITLKILPEEKPKEQPTQPPASPTEPAVTSSTATAPTTTPPVVTPSPVLSPAPVVTPPPLVSQPLPPEGPPTSSSPTLSSPEGSPGPPEGPPLGATEIGNI